MTQSEERTVVLRIGDECIYDDETFECIGSCGFMIVRIKGKTGVRESRFKHEDGELIPFFPNLMSVSTRRKLVMKLFRNMTSQKDIANFFNVTSGVVHGDIRHMSHMKPKPQEK